MTAAKPTMREALLLCPFCGGSGKMRSYRTSEDSEGAHVECTNCGARTEATDDAYADTATAALLWNNRAALLSPAPEPVAWRYRWKLDGEWTSWHVSDHSQKSEGLRDLEEIPLYASPPSPALPDREAIARIIHPVGFEEDSMEYVEVVAAYRKEALAKADYILKLMEGR